MMRKQTVILLTACISPGGMAFTALQDAGERERQYIDAINFYIENTHYPIVFCNNSGEDISSKITTPEGRVEFLSYYGNDYDKQLGKGYGEFQIIEYAFRNSQFLSNAHTVIKITGRLKVNHLSLQIKLSRIIYWCLIPYVLISEINIQNRFACSECIIAEKRFFLDYFLKRNRINDSKNYFFEHQLFDSIIETPYNMQKFCFPIEIEGFSGTTGAEYSVQSHSFTDKLQYLRNELLRLTEFANYNIFQKFCFGLDAVIIRIVKFVMRHLYQA